MPYRRLPTTDKARRRALDAVIKQASKTDESKLVFSKHTLHELNERKNQF